MDDIAQRVMDEREAQASFEKKQLSEKAKKGPLANRIVAEAALIARNQIESEGIRATFSEADYQYHHTPRQALQAACHAREDVIATLVIQASVLTLLVAIRRLSWVTIALLAYIAYKLS